jgi:hypothetical protein
MITGNDEDKQLCPMVLFDGRILLKEPEQGGAPCRKRLTDIVMRLKRSQRSGKETT